MSRKKYFSDPGSRFDEHLRQAPKEHKQYPMMEKEATKPQPVAGPDRGWWWYRLLEKFDAL